MGEMTTAREPIKATTVLQRLMLELIYPAVLGSVLIFALETTRALFRFRIVCGAAVDPLALLILLKCLLLYVTVIFYSCDYVYTMLTREFQILFFLFDCAFLIGLYLTLVSLKVAKEELTELPVPWRIAGFYVLFLLTYWVWDRSERKKLQETKSVGQEKWRGLETWRVLESSGHRKTLREEEEEAILNNELGFYEKVLKWEKLSLAAMVPTTLVAWWLRDIAWASVLLLAVIVYITGGFYRVVRMKRDFAFLDDAG
jgi:hypothetical protein